MSYECVFGDICYRWSLGVFATEAEARAAGNSHREHAKRAMDGVDEDFEVLVEATGEPLRGPIIPSSKSYDNWLARRPK